MDDSLLAADSGVGKLNVSRLLAVGGVAGTVPCLTSHHAPHICVCGTLSFVCPPKLSNISPNAHGAGPHRPGTQQFSGDPIYS